MDRLMKRRIIFWMIVAIYTISLPYAINVYEALVSLLSIGIAVLIPLFMIVTVGSIYVIHGIRMHRPFRYIALIVPCTVVVGLIIFLEPNQTKHIHIPEYILMSWLVFEAVRIDYFDEGIYLAVFVLALFLGAADEIHQGIHPTRFYGWPDMIVNGVSSMIGVVSIIGVRGKYNPSGWSIPRFLSLRKRIAALIVAGMVSIVINGYVLLSVAGSDSQWRNFPDRLGGWDMIFVVLAGVGCVALRGSHADNADYNHVVFQAWRPVICVSLILMAVIHLVIIGALLGDVPFR